MQYLKTMYQTVLIEMKQHQYHLPLQTNMMLPFNHIGWIFIYTSLDPRPIDFTIRNSSSGQINESQGIYRYDIMSNDDLIGVETFTFKIFKSFYAGHYNLMYSRRALKIENKLLKSSKTDVYSIIVAQCR